MSSGVEGGASRVSIPTGVKKTIDNIKEITGPNHSVDEIYAMLKECSMDPNETAQKLLLLDTFHEVKRKRDRKKENLNKESAELKWKQGTQARANRVARGNYSSRHISHDAGGGRNSTAIKENATGHLPDKNTGKGPLASSQDMRKNETSVVSLTTAVSNGRSCQTTNVVMHGSDASAGGRGMKDIQQHQMLEVTDIAASIPLAPASGSYSISSDPVLLLSQDSSPPNAVDSTTCEVGVQQAPSELVDDKPTENISFSAKTSTSDVGIINSQPKMSNDVHGLGKNQHLVPIQTACSIIGVSTGSRPSSNYNNRSQKDFSTENSSKDLLKLESNSAACVESKLFVCKKDGSFSASDAPRQKPTISPLPKSRVLGKVKNFLEVLSESNKKLLQDSKDNPDNYDIEVLSGNESKYIEMDLMLGIADLHTPEVVAVAECSIAGGYQQPLPLSESSSGLENEDSSDEEDDDRNQDKINEKDNGAGSQYVKLGSDDDGRDTSCKESKKQKSKKRPKIVELP